MTKIPIADLHCDLLCYLMGNPARTALDPAVRCSIPQLREGNVAWQTMAVFSETHPQSSSSAKAQIEIFKKLPDLYPNDFIMVRSPDQLKSREIKQIGILLSLENASTLCSESDSLEEGIKFLENIEKNVSKIIYISMTWNTENRFGGGALTEVGLKPDGKRLLDFLHLRRIALDFSHASDKLAYDTLNYIDAHSLDIPVIASHSNFRSVADAPRNLPDDLAKEIIKRKGIIGFNFVRPFVGAESTENFVRQFEHALQLGFEQNLCFGADFFYGDDVSPAFRKKPEDLFFPGYDHAGTYGKVLDAWKRAKIVTPLSLEGIAHSNLREFLKNRIL